MDQTKQEMSEQMTAPADLQKYLETLHGPENVHFVGMTGNIARYQIRQDGRWTTHQYQRG